MDLQHADVDGATHGFREAGSGAPLVFLHGILADSRFWHPQLEGLSDSHRVIAWDAPGAGGSDDPAPSFGIGGYADSLSRFLQVIDAEPATLVGLSWGGILALEFYRRHQGQVARLVLADTYAGWKGSLTEAEYESRRRSALEQFESGGVPDEIPNVLHPDARPEAHRVHEEMMGDARPSGFEAMGRAMLDVDSTDVLGTISVPTLLVWGEEDQRSPLEVAHVFKAAIPDARLAVIPGAGHASSIEHPSAFNQAIRDFA